MNLLRIIDAQSKSSLSVNPEVEDAYPLSATWDFMSSDLLSAHQRTASHCWPHAIGRNCTERNLICMHETTTVRVTRATHRELRERADRDGLTLEAEIRRLLRYDRQRRIAEALATDPLTTEEAQIIRSSAATVTRNIDAGR